VDNTWGLLNLKNSCPEMKHLIDLTNTNRYYNQQQAFEMGFNHVKIKTEGHVIPNPAVVKDFFTAVDSALAENETSLVGVHCTHGLNRTGYLVCRYMVQKMDIEPETAIREFDEARGHKQERANYLTHLKNLGKDDRSEDVSIRDAASVANDNEVTETASMTYGEYRRQKALEETIVKSDHPSVSADDIHSKSKKGKKHHKHKRKKDKKSGEEVRNNLPSEAHLGHNSDQHRIFNGGYSNDSYQTQQRVSHYSQQGPSVGRGAVNNYGPCGESSQNSYNQPYGRGGPSSQYSWRPPPHGDSYEGHNRNTYGHGNGQSFGRGGGAGGGYYSHGQRHDGTGRSYGDHHSRSQDTGGQLPVAGRHSGRESRDSSRNLSQKRSLDQSNCDKQSYPKKHMKRHKHKQPPIQSEGGVFL